MSGRTQLPTLPAGGRGAGPGGAGFSIIPAAAAVRSLPRAHLSRLIRSPLLPSLGVAVFCFLRFWCLRPVSTVINHGSRGLERQRRGVGSVRAGPSRGSPGGHRGRFRRRLSGRHSRCSLSWDSKKRQPWRQDPCVPPRALAGPAARISPAHPVLPQQNPSVSHASHPWLRAPRHPGVGERAAGHPQGLSRHTAWLRAVSGQSERLRNPVVDREAGRGDPQLRPTELRTPVSELRGGGSEARTRPSASGSEAAGKAGGRGRPCGLGEPEEPRPQWGDGLPFLSIA